MKLTILAALFFMMSVPGWAAPQFKVTQLTYAGSGCPGGTAKVVNTDPNWFMINFYDFETLSKPGLRFSSGRKTCQMLIGLDYPQGWQYTVDGVWLFGLDVSLASRASGTVKISSYVQGQRSTGTAEKTYHGSKRWRGQLDIHPQHQWSPCGATRAANVKFELRAKGRDSYAKLALTDKAKKSG